MLRISVILLLGVAGTQAVKLPPFFTQCKKSDLNFNNCILENIQKGFGDFSKGHDSYHIQSIAPLKVPKLYMNINGGLIIDLKDLTVTGLDAAVFSKASMDLDKKVIDLEFMTPILRCEGQYNTNGKILIVPIQGKGPMNVTFVDPQARFTMYYEIQKKGDREFIVPTKNTFKYIITNAFFELENLFDGNKRLNDEMTKFLNENWKEVNEEIGEKVGEGIGEVLQLLVANFFSKVPYNDLIDE